MTTATERLYTITLESNGAVAMYDWGNGAENLEGCREIIENGVGMEDTYVVGSLRWSGDSMTAYADYVEEFFSNLTNDYVERTETLTFSIDEEN